MLGKGNFFAPQGSSVPNQTKKSALRAPHFDSGGTTTSTTSPDPAAGGYVQNLFGNAQTLAGAHPTAPSYINGNPNAGALNANLLAGFTPDQQMAFQGIRAYQGAAVPWLTQAGNLSLMGAAPISGNLGLGTPQQLSDIYGYGTNLLSSGTGYLGSGYDMLGAGFGSAYDMPQFSQEEISRYQSPHTQAVLDATLANMDKQHAIDRTNFQSKAIGSGAFGGDRAGLAAAELQRNQDLARGQTAAGILQQGYSQSLDEFNKQQQMAIARAQQMGQLGSQTAQLGALNTGIGSALTGAGLQGQNTALNAYSSDAARRANAAMQMGVIGQETMSTGLQGINALLGSGTLQQNQNQQGLNIPYLDWQREQAWPYQQLGWQSGLLGSLGGLLGGTSRTTVPSPSALSQFGGLGITGLGALGLLNQSGALKGLSGLNPFSSSTPGATGNLSDAGGTLGGAYSGVDGSGAGATEFTGPPELPTWDSGDFGSDYYPTFDDFTARGGRIHRARGGALHYDGGGPTPLLAFDVSDDIADRVTGDFTGMSDPGSGEGRGATGTSSSSSSSRSGSSRSLGDRALSMGTKVASNMGLSALAQATGIPGSAIGAALGFGKSMYDMMSMSNIAEEGGMPGASFRDFAVAGLNGIDPTRGIMNTVNDLFGTNYKGVVASIMDIASDPELAAGKEAVERAQRNQQNYDDMNRSPFEGVGGVGGAERTSIDQETSDRWSADRDREDAESGRDMRDASERDISDREGTETAGGDREGSDRDTADSGGGDSGSAWRGGFIHKDGGGGLVEPDVGRTLSMLSPQYLKLIASMSPPSSREGQAARAALSSRQLGPVMAALDESAANSNFMPMDGTYAYGGSVPMPSFGPGPVASMPGAGMPMMRRGGHLTIPRDFEAVRHMRRHFDEGGDVGYDDAEIIDAETVRRARLERALGMGRPGGTAAPGRPTSYGVSLPDWLTSPVSDYVRSINENTRRPAADGSGMPRGIAPSPEAALGSPGFSLPPMRAPAPEEAPSPVSEAEQIRRDRLRRAMGADRTPGGSAEPGRPTTYSLPDVPEFLTQPVPHGALHRGLNMPAIFDSLRRRDDDQGITPREARGMLGRPAQAPSYDQDVPPPPPPADVDWVRRYAEDGRDAPPPAGALSAPPPPDVKPRAPRTTLLRPETPVETSVLTGTPAVAPNMRVPEQNQRVALSTPSANDNDKPSSNWMSSPWAGLVALGLGTMGGGSPYGLQNLGNAGINAMKFMGQQRQEDLREKQAKDLAEFHKMTTQNAALRLQAEIDKWHTDQQHQANTEDITREHNRNTAKYQEGMIGVHRAQTAETARLRSVQEGREDRMLSETHPIEIFNPETNEFDIMQVPKFPSADNPYPKPPKGWRFSRGNANPEGAMTQKQAEDAARLEVQMHQKEVENGIISGAKRQTPWETDGVSLKDWQERRTNEIYRRGRPGSAAVEPARIAPPAPAVAALRAKPELAPEFDLKYGPGAAARLLGGQ